jgi:hypothetical protein
MMAIRAAAALLVAALASKASASVTVSAFAGWSDVRLSTAREVARGESGDASSIGGSVVAKLNLLGVGLSIEHHGGTTQPWASSVLMGALVDVGRTLRLEALAEAGRWGDDVGALFGSRGSWLFGVRPGLSVPLRLGGPAVRLGVSGIVRWNTAAGAFGPPEFGSVGWLGLEL